MNVLPRWLRKVQRRIAMGPERDPAGLSPYERALVDAGPDCRCRHARSDHVGVSDLEFPDRWGLMRGIGFFDGPCQVKGCECTPAGYIPGDGRSYAEVAP